MANKEMMRQLYERMVAEQQKYKAWLLEQPPNVILDNTCKFTVREDIVMELEVLELTDAQAAALLRSRTPAGGCLQGMAAGGNQPHERCTGCDRGPCQRHHTG